MLFINVDKQIRSNFHLNFCCVCNTEMDLQLCSVAIQIMQVEVPTYYSHTNELITEYMRGGVDAY